MTAVTEDIRTAEPLLAQRIAGRTFEAIGKDVGRAGPTVFESIQRAGNRHVRQIAERIREATREGQVMLLMFRRAETRTGCSATPFGCGASFGRSASSRSTSTAASRKATLSRGWTQTPVPD